MNKWKENAKITNFADANKMGDKRESIKKKFGEEINGKGEKLKF